MRGVKRSTMVWMLAFIPLVSAAAISPFQNSLLPQSAPVIAGKDLFPVFEKHSGMASWYSKTDPKINFRTASGEIFDDSDLTCASWYYPFGTLLRVTNLETGKSVLVRVNDRGPSKRLNRLIDLTKGAFSKIEDPGRGLARVSVKEMDLEEALEALDFKRLAHPIAG